MYTQISIDEHLVQQATNLAGQNNPQELIETLLREFILRRKSDPLAQAFGQYRWEGDLDKMRIDS